MTDRQEESRDYDFRLDNAAKIFPGMLSKRRTTIFRVSATIDKPVSVSLLEEAYEKMLTRCPYFRVELRKGLFWYYLEETDVRGRVEAESRFPCLYVPYKKRGVLLHRVIAYRNRIAFEVAHCLTDGTGALNFLNGILFEYFRLRGDELEDSGLLIDSREPAKSGEYEDSFRKNYKKGIPAAKGLSPALHLGGKPVSHPAYFFIEGVMESAQLKARAADYNATIGEFLTALLIYVAQEEMELRNMRPKPIRISIPINLRRFYGSNTMRNFVLAVEPGIDPRLGRFSLEEIVEKVHHFMCYELDHRFIRRQIVRNVHGETNPLIKIVPLGLKDLILRRMYTVLGTRMFTVGFSNLGRVSLPESMRPLVKEYRFIPPPHNNALNATSIAYDGRTSVLFASTLEDRRLEARFFKWLREIGVSVRIRTNRR